MTKRTFLRAMLVAEIIGLMSFAHAETRCGIITNDLPGGALTLDDRDASWRLDPNGVPDKMPDTERGQQCGCVEGTTNAATHEFTSVTGGKLKPMNACESDKKLMRAFNARNHQ